jgi:uncharacterized delta-60 repeat protein
MIWTRNATQGALTAVAFAALAATLLAQEKPVAAKGAVGQPAITIALDPSFGSGGYVAEYLDAKAQVGALGRFLAVDAEGRPVIAGNSPSQRFSIARYTAAGKPDATFAGTGKASVCIEDDATVEAAASTEVQFTHGGAIDAKGRIILIGKGAGLAPVRKWDFALLRFLPTGQLDQSFAGVGWRKFQAHEAWNIGLSVVAAPDCSVLAAGYAQNEGGPGTDPLLIRFRESGEVDEAFSATANGSLRWLIKENTPGTATSVTLDARGRCLVVMNLRIENRYFWSVARLNSEGEIDETFGERGLWKGSLDENSPMEMAYSVVVDAAGRIVLSGYSYDGANGLRRLAVARLTDRGRLDGEFGPDCTGHVILTDYGANVGHRYGPRAAVMKDRIAIAGTVQGAKETVQCFGVAVFDRDGKSVAKIEPRIFPGSKGVDQPWGIAFDPEGRLVVGGASQAVNNKMRFAVARYLVK